MPAKTRAKKYGILEAEIFINLPQQHILLKIKTPEVWTKRFVFHTLKKLMEIIATCSDDYSPEVYTCSCVFPMYRASLAFYEMTNLIKVNSHFSHNENLMVKNII